MSAPVSILDSVRRCEAEIWRALLGAMRMTLESWSGSDVERGALARVSDVIADQVERTSDKKGEKQWTH